MLTSFFIEIYLERSLFCAHEVHIFQQKDFSVKGYEMNMEIGVRVK